MTTGQETFPLSMAERTQLIKLRLKGADFNQILKDEIAQGKQSVEDKTNQIFSVLEQRQKETQRVLQELTNEVKVFNPLEESEKQVQNLTQTLQKLEKIQEDLFNKTIASEQELKEQQQQQNHLNSMLNSLQRSLNTNHSTLPFQNTIFEIGQETCRYIAK